MTEDPFGDREAGSYDLNEELLPRKVIKGLSKHGKLLLALAQITKGLRHRSTVVAAILSGSAATGNVDDFSDIDLLVVASNQGFDATWQLRREIEDSGGDVVFRIDLVEVMETSAVAFYRNGVKVHITYMRDTSLQEDLEYREAVVLFSRSHRVDAWLDTCKSALSRVDATRLIEDDRRFWFWLLQGTAKLARGEMWAAYDTLQTLRAIIVKMRENASSVPFQGYRRIEQRWGEQELKALRSTVARVNKKELHAAYVATVAIYDHLRCDATNRTGVEWGVTRHSQDFARALVDKWLFKSLPAERSQR